MTEEYSLDKVSKEIQGGMAYYMNPVEALPLYRKSLRFAVARANGLSSNSWRIKVGSRGDAYVACRSHFPGLRISLHRSGRCHMAFDSNPRNGEGHYMDQWQAPSPTLAITEDAYFIPSFRLTFANYALRLDQERRDYQQGIWDKNEVYVESPESPYGTVISFLVVDKSIQEMKCLDSLGYPLAVMPAWPDRNLWVMVTHEYEKDMIRVAGDIARGAGDNLDQNAVREMNAMSEGKILTLTASVETTDGSRSFMPFPVEVREKEDGIA